jgi:CRISPR-associated protein Csb2
MSRWLAISMRFLSTTFHGRGDGGEPEWPPSPLRVYQALVAAAAARWNQRTKLEYAVPALEWLAKQHAPTVVAAVGVPSDVKYRLYVPDNVADKVAKAWRGGNNTASIADYRTEKDVRPTHLINKNDEFAAVHYLYPIADAAEFAKHKQILIDAARSVTHLGWGVDMVAGNATEMTAEEAVKLAGERWEPSKDGSGTPLRVPRPDTLQALMDKHAAFLGRLAADGFKPVPPLTAFAVVGYGRDTDMVSRPFAAFELRSLDFSRFQPYDPARRTRDVAGMVRNATAILAGQTRPFGWTDANINAFVHGHTPDGTDRARGDAADRRFSYLPLPSLEHRPSGIHVGAIRRVLIVAPSDHRDAVLWSRVLSGQELSPVGDTQPSALRLIDGTESSLRRNPNLRAYVGESSVWSTVTPVVLHRHAPQDPGEVRQLFDASFRHAGFSEQVTRHLELEWRQVGFRAGVDLAKRYETPEKLTGPRYHVRVRFAHPIRGPLTVGAGRYRGMGLFAAEAD